MASSTSRFSFKSSALPESTFDLVSFNGSEGLSKFYRFEVTLLSDDDQIDLDKVVQSRATLTINREQGDILIHGIFTVFDQQDTSHGRTRYHAVITPAVWRMTITHHNQIFLDKTVPQIVEAAIKDGGFTSLDYEIRVSARYPKLEYVCQYDESHADFIFRLMEREGIYYYFEQGEEQEKLIITDALGVHGYMSAGSKLSYSPVSGLDEAYRDEVVKALVCSRKIMPKRVLLKDYNYRKPLLDLEAQSIVSENGQGDVYIYGEHFQTPDDGARLAKIRAEELKCRARSYYGESLVPFLRPGYIFTLQGHNRTDCNISYLITDVTHNGDQSFMLTSGLGMNPSSRDQTTHYRNSFTAISSSMQFRPERITPRARFYGTIHAHIDASGSGKYAEIDSHGRYKVKLPFDLNDPAGGKASSWIRMSQPYAGDSYGMHFPLHKGTEVLLTYIDGDPDRPIIAGAVPNPVTESPVTSANNTQCRITTAGGNKFHIEDQQGGERMLMLTPQSNTWFRMGAPNDPPRWGKPSVLKQADGGGGSGGGDGGEGGGEESGFSLFSKGGFEGEVSWENKLIVGEQTEVVLGAKNDFLLGMESSTTIGSSVETFAGAKMDITLGNTFEFYKGNVYTYTKENELTGIENVEIKAGGDSPGFKAALATMVLATAANSAVAATAHSWLPKHSKGWLCGVDLSSMAICTALSCLIPLAFKKPETFASTIKLDKLGIDVISPQIKIAHTKTNPTTFLNVLQDTVGAQSLLDMTFQSTTGACSVTAMTNLNLTATGNILCSGTAGITNNSGADISNNAGANLVNSAFGSLTETGESVNISGTTKVAIEAATGNVTLNAVTGGVSVSAPAGGSKVSGLTVELVGTTSVTIGGGLIKIGDLATPVVIPPLDATINAQKVKLEGDIAKLVTAKNAAFAKINAQRKAYNALQQAIWALEDTVY